MNLEQLRSLTRTRLDDWKTDRLWTDTELNEYLNQSVNEAAIRARNIVDSSSNCTLIDVTANTASYGMNSAIFFVDRVFDVTQGVYLQKTGVDELDRCYGQWESVTGTPTHYIEDVNHYGTDCAKNRSIRLYPIPSANTQLRLTVYRTPLKEMGDNDEPEIPGFLHADLIWWAMHLAYMKQDADTYNSDKALECEAHFDKSFGDKQSARLLEYRRKHRRIRVVGSYL